MANCATCLVRCNIKQGDFVMMTLEDIASIPHGEGKAAALTLWKRLQLIDKAFHDMCDSFEPREPNGDKIYHTFIALVESGM